MLEYLITEVNGNVYIMNNTGPSTGPCGRPPFKGNGTAWMAFKVTAWVSSDKYDSNQNQTSKTVWPA